jgi:outer membrane protein OmpA-like peptidoglycan-associated protein
VSRLVRTWGRLAALFTAAAVVTLAGCASKAPPPPVVKAPATPVKTSQIIPIQQIDRGVLIVMPVEKVSFDFGKATITAVEAHEFLDRVASILKDKTTARAVLEGHTDNLGSRPLNQALSEDRAASVRRELAGRGVDHARLDMAGFAFDKPVAPNDSEAGRRENRRVELIILGETVANITRGEPEGSFEVAFGRLKAMLEAGMLKPTPGK